MGKMFLSPPLSISSIEQEQSCQRTIDAYQTVDLLRPPALTEFEEKFDKRQEKCACFWQKKTVNGVD